MYTYYKVAEHIFGVSVTDQRMLDNILPSFVPFLFHVEDKMPDLLFSVSVNEEIITGNELLHTFDWEDSICSMFQSENGYTVELTNKRTKLTERMDSVADWSMIRTSVKIEDPASAYFLNQFIMMAYSFASASSNTLMMHASVIESDGRGMLFLGKSGTGKSTHTRLWLKHISGCSLLNDDNPIIRLNEDGKALVYGSPWSGKTPCYRNIVVPVCAFIRLKQAPYNRLLRLSPAQAFASVLPSCSNMVWDKKIHDAVCQTIAAMIPNVKVAQLECLPDKDAAQLSNTLLS